MEMDRFNDNYEYIPEERDEDDVWDDSLAPSYDEELDFNRDIETEYLPDVIDEEEVPEYYDDGV